MTSVIPDPGGLPVFTAGLFSTSDQITNPGYEPRKALHDGTLDQELGRGEGVYQRLWEVLRGEDTSDTFAHLSGRERRAILEILEETDPWFAAQPTK